MLIISTPDKRYYSDEPKYKNEFHVKELNEAEFRDLLERYFRTVLVMRQRSVSASFIEPEEGERGMVWYDGSFDKISKVRGITKAPFLVVLATDGSLPPMNTSLFDATAILHDMLRELHETHEMHLRVNEDHHGESWSRPAPN